jgi:hypothetical protein
MNPDHAILQRFSLPSELGIFQGAVRVRTKDKADRFSNMLFVLQTL